MNCTSNGNQYDFVIVGGGIAGLSLAILLKDYKVIVLEKRDENENENSRTVNFTITKRGMDTLDKINLKDTVLRNCMKLRYRCIHLENGSVKKVKYGKDGIHSIKRTKLLSVLKNKMAEIQNAEIIYNANVVHMDMDSAAVTFERNGKDITLKGGAVIVANGSNSNLRNYFSLKSSADVSTKCFKWQFIEIMANCKDGDLLSHSLHIWPRKNAILIGMPNVDNSISMMYMVKNMGCMDRKDIVNEFVTNFPNEYKWINEIKEQLTIKPISSLVETSISKWSYKNKILFLGDSCHSVLPFYGQGMNSALESSLKLYDEIKSNNILKAFELYEKNRKKDMYALSLLSRRHFKTIKGGWLNYIFRSQSLLDTYVSKMTFGLWWNEYSKVAHSNHSFCKIYRRVRIQELIKKTVVVIIVFSILNLFR